MKNSRNPRSRFTARQFGSAAIVLRRLRSGRSRAVLASFIASGPTRTSRKPFSRRAAIPAGAWTSSRSSPPRSRGSPIPTIRKCRRLPPDDPAAEALSPVPQWPDNRLLVPPEGTGYMDLLEYWRRDDQAKQRAAGLPVPEDEPEYWQRPDNGRHAITDPRQPGMPGQPLSSPAGPPVPPEVPSPFIDNVPYPSPARPAAPGGASAPPGGASAPPGPQTSNTRKPSGLAGDTTSQVIRLQSGDPVAKSAQNSSIKTGWEIPYGHESRDKQTGIDAN